MKIFKKKIVIIVIVIVVVLTGLGIGVGEYFVNYALSPSSNSDQRNVKDNIELLEGDRKIIETNKVIEEDLGNEFEKTTQETFIKSEDGLKLAGKYRLQEESHQWVIAIHGYKGNNTGMMSYASRYFDKGYNVLLPNNRAHENSEGDYIGMGWLDKDDIAKWVEWIVEQDDQAEIILHGVSMGGATVMMTSGYNLDHVIGYIEDCGYTSVWDIFASELDKRFSLPTFPILDISNLIASLQAGYDFKDASSITQVSQTKKPMLFIHGGKDDFVPTSMVYEVYEAATCKKDLYLVDAAGHGESKDYNPDAYWNQVFNFINEKIEKE